MGGEILLGREGMEGMSGRRGAGHQPGGTPRQEGRMGRSPMRMAVPWQGLSELQSWLVHPRPVGRMSALPETGWLLLLVLI